MKKSISASAMTLLGALLASGNIHAATSDGPGAVQELVQGGYIQVDQTGGIKLRGSVLQTLNAGGYVTKQAHTAEAAGACSSTTGICDTMK